MKYTFVRLWDNALGWLVNNPERVDGEGNRIPLAQEVKVALPGMPFQMRYSRDVLTFEFEEELSSDDYDLLDTTIYNHQHNISS